MKNHILFSIVFIIYFIVACSSPERSASRTPPVPMEGIDYGKPTFEEKCMVCHGDDGTAGIANAANLKTSKLDTASVLQIITDGKNGMSAFKDQLSGDEIEQVANYVFKLRK